MLRLIGRPEDSMDCAPTYFCLMRQSVNSFLDAYREEHWEKFKDSKYYEEFRHSLEHDLNVCISLITRCQLLMDMFSSP